MNHTLKSLLITTVVTLPSLFAADITVNAEQNEADTGGVHTRYALRAMTQEEIDQLISETKKEAFDPTATPFVINMIANRLYRMGANADAEEVAQLARNHPKASIDDIRNDAKYFVQSGEVERALESYVRLATHEKAEIYHVSEAFYDSERIAPERKMDLAKLWAVYAKHKKASPRHITEATENIFKLTPEDTELLAEMSLQLARHPEATIYDRNRSFRSLEKMGEKYREATIEVLNLISDQSHKDLRATLDNARHFKKFGLTQKAVDLCQFVLSNEKVSVEYAKQAIEELKALGVTIDDSKKAEIFIAVAERATVELLSEKLAAANELKAMGDVHHQDAVRIYREILEQGYYLWSNFSWVSEAVQALYAMMKMSSIEVEQYYTSIILNLESSDYVVSRAASRLRELGLNETTPKLLEQRIYNKYYSHHRQ